MWRNETGINYVTGFQNTSGILNLAAKTLFYSSDNLSRCQKVTFLSVILLLFAIKCASNNSSSTAVEDHMTFHSTSKTSKLKQHTWHESKGTRSLTSQHIHAFCAHALMGIGGGVTYVTFQDTISFNLLAPELFF